MGEGPRPETDFDAAAKEAALLREAASWDTSSPVKADPGDVPTIDIGPYFESGDVEALHSVGAALREASENVGFHQLVGHGLVEEGEAILTLTTTSGCRMEPSLASVRPWSGTPRRSPALPSASCRSTPRHWICRPDNPPKYPTISYPESQARVQGE